MPQKLGPKLTLTLNKLPDLVRAMKRLADTRVMVGIPKETTTRMTDDGHVQYEHGQPLTNAMIGYIQEHGAPEARIPARPHLYPTVRENRPLIVKMLRSAGRAAMHADIVKMDAIFEAMGMRVSTAVKRKIVSVIPPPLSERTIKQRLYKQKTLRTRKRLHALYNASVAAGKGGTDVFTPLIDTGDYIAHITYVLRRKSSGKDIAVGPVRGVRGQVRVNLPNNIKTKP